MLREPKSHLRRAGIVLLTNALQAGDEKLASLREEVARLAPDRPIFTGDLSPIALLDVRGSEVGELSWLNGRRVGAMCALGNPASFESMLGDLGAILAKRYRFRDHHAITQREFEHVTWKSEQAGAEAVVTSEKDAVKMVSAKAELPLLVLRVAMVVSDEAAFTAAIRQVVDPVKLTLN
jgi:tetraacyldisaccharide-1-P 4'-kinase